MRHEISPCISSFLTVPVAVGRAVTHRLVDSSFEILVPTDNETLSFTVAGSRLVLDVTLVIVTDAACGGAELTFKTLEEFSPLILVLGVPNNL